MSQDFLRALWQPPTGYGEIRAIKDGRVHQEFISLDTPDAYELAETAAAEYDNDDYDVYIGVLRRKNQGGKATDVADLAPVLWADIDPYKPALVVDSSLHHVLNFTIPPSIIVDSGHGIHAYWLLAEMGVAISLARDAMKGIAKAIGGDHTYDPARVLRLPGTHNHKNGESVPVRLLRLDVTRRYRFSDFSEYVEAATPRILPYAETMAELMGADRPRPAAPVWLLDLIEQGVPKGQRSEQCFKAMIWMLRYGWTPGDIYLVFRDNPQGIGAKMVEIGPRGADYWFNRTLAAAKEQA